MLFHILLEKAFEVQKVVSVFNSRRITKEFLKEIVEPGATTITLALQRAIWCLPCKSTTPDCTKLEPILNSTHWYTSTDQILIDYKTIRCTDSSNLLLVYVGLYQYRDDCILCSGSKSFEQ